LKTYAQAGESAWCYYDNKESNGKIYGKLYNWYAVNDPRGLAPKGWPIPSDSDWVELSDFLGVAEKASAKMKNKTGWNEVGNGTNSSFFTGFTGGSRSNNGNFSIVVGSGNRWGSTVFDAEDACRRYLFCNDVVLNSGYYSKGCGFSVCYLRD